MARPVKRDPEQWKADIQNAARRLFLSKGFEETSIAEIMALAGGAKGMFYRFFRSKEEVMQALGDRLFFENDPFAAVRGRADLNGLQKLKTLLALDRADTDREQLRLQAAPIFEDPRLLASAVEANRRVLTPLWRELLEEGCRDGSIQTEYSRELAELLPLINFWLIPSIFPAAADELRHKYRFIRELLCKMGLPILDEEKAAHDEALLEAAAADAEKAARSIEPITMPANPAANRQGAAGGALE